MRKNTNPQREQEMTQMAKLLKENIKNNCFNKVYIIKKLQRSTAY